MTRERHTNNQALELDAGKLRDTSQSRDAMWLARRARRRCAAQECCRRNGDMNAWDVIFLSALLTPCHMLVLHFTPLCLRT